MRFRSVTIRYLQDRSVPVDIGAEVPIESREVPWSAHTFSSRQSPEGCSTSPHLLRELPSVERADAVTGPADLIALVNAPDPRALAELIFRSVQTIAGVKETDTRIVVIGD